MRNVLRNIFEEIRQYSNYLSENEEVSEMVYTVMGPQDILPVLNSTKLMKTNVICSLNSMKLHKLLENVPEEISYMKLMSDTTASSDNYLKHFKFPVLAARD